MDFLQNLPTHPIKLKELVQGGKGQVVSMSLSAVDNCQLTMLAIAEGESISEEAYTGDVWYYLVSGKTILTIGEESYHLHAGETMAVPAGVLHGIGGGSAFQIIQLVLSR